MNDEAAFNQQLYAKYDYESFLERREDDFICRNGVHCDHPLCPDHNGMDWSDGLLMMTSEEHDQSLV